MSTPPIALITVAWNQLDKTLACLESVSHLTYPSVRTILVDNGSEPPLAEAVAARFPMVELLRLPQNQGFAGGYNAGIEAALAGDAEALFLLNNDAIVAPDALDHLMAALSEAPDVGMAAAKVYYAGDPQRIWTVGNNLDLFLDVKDGGEKQIDTGQWAKPRDIEFAPFCAVLLRRAAVEQTGLLDEQFFLYYEDLDYCRRLKAGGWRLRFSPEAHVWHDVSLSSGGRDSPMERYYMAQSSGRYFRKHGGGVRMLAIVPFRSASALRTTGRLARGGRWGALRAYWTGLSRGWRTGQATAPPPDWVTGKKN